MKNTILQFIAIVVCQLVVTGCMDLSHPIFNFDWGDEYTPSKGKGGLVPVTMGAAYGESVCETGTDELAVSVKDGNLRVWYRGCFACEFVKHEAVVKPTTAGYDILFQPPEMEHHNACGDQTYDMRLIAGSGEAGDVVTVYTRSDRDEDPVKRLSATAETDPVDCAALVPCGIESPCSNEGMSMDQRSDDYIMGCTMLDSCGGSFCVWDQEACLMECGELECGIQESYPLQTACR